MARHNDAVGATIADRPPHRSVGDEAVFLRYGSVDVALGWPLRYSYSPGT